MSSFASASPQDNARKILQEKWAKIKYEEPVEQKEKLLEVLALESEKAIQDFPQQAEIMIWRAIILSTYAGEKGGLAALGLVKEAKSLLEESIKLNPQALKGSAYTSLGTLYYQVPGWPIGFGNDKKARFYLQEALKINPDGIDSNFFYADFLVEQNDKITAIKLLEHALEASDRPGREIADKGRRAEIRALMDQLR